MKDNARCIRLLASTGCNMFSPSYSAYLLKEMQRLDELIRDERGTSDIYPNHYTDVKERVVYNALVPKCMATGRVNMALALLGMMEENEQDFYTKGRHSQPDYVIEGDYAWNSDYSPWNEYFAVMDTISADVLAGYFKYISMEQSDPFEQYVVSQVYPNKNYYNDLIGTRYMAEGRFADALPYLEKVSLGFLSQQNISWYMANRKYSLPRWFNRQLPNMPDTDGPGKGEPKENMKLKYCKDMLQLQANYDLARDGEQKDMRAYELAVMHYQASCYGDCCSLRITATAFTTAPATANSTLRARPLSISTSVLCLPTSTCATRRSMRWPLSTRIRGLTSSTTATIILFTSRVLPQVSIRP